MLSAAMVLNPAHLPERQSHPVSPSRVKQLTPVFYPFGTGVFFCPCFAPLAFLSGDRQWRGFQGLV